MKERNASDEEPGREGALRNTIYRQITRSGRRMGRLRRALYGLAGTAGCLGSCDCGGAAVVSSRSLAKQHLDAVLARAPSFLPCYWHQHQLFCGYYLLQAQQRRRLRVGFLISPSVDGELGAMIIRRVGGVVIRGSSSYTGALALKGYFEALVHEQVSPVINPGRASRATLQVQAGRRAAGAALGSSHAADGLRRLARMAGALGPLRAADAGQPHRHRLRPTTRGCASARCGGRQAITLDMERALHATYQSARAALQATSRRPDVSA